MKILYSNNVKTATIVATSEQIGFEWSVALADDRLARIGRFIGCTSESLVFDFTTAKSCTYTAILAHNLTSSATITLEANATNVWTAPSFTVTMSYAESVVTAFSAAQSYRYWRMTIADATNTAGYIQIGCVYIGSDLTMPGMSPDQSIPMVSTDESALSNTGQIYGNPGYLYYTASITFPSISDTDKKLIQTFYTANRTYTPFILLVWESDLTIQPPIYSVLTKGLDWSKNAGSGLDWKLGLEFREVK